MCSFPFFSPDALTLVAVPSFPLVMSTCGEEGDKALGCGLGYYSLFLRSPSCSSSMTKGSKGSDHTVFAFTESQQLLGMGKCVLERVHKSLRWCSGSFNYWTHTQAHTPRLKTHISFMSPASDLKDSVYSSRMVI